MSVGYLLAAEADIDGVREVAAGFGLEAIGASTLGGQQATVATLANAANVGIVLSTDATRDAAFVALLLALSSSLRAAQLILATPNARDAFPFLPASWPVMALDEARHRSADLVRRRAGQDPGVTELPHARPLPPVVAPPPVEVAPPPAPPVEVAPPAPPPEPEQPAVGGGDDVLTDAKDEDTTVAPLDDGEVETTNPTTETFGTGGGVAPEPASPPAQQEPPPVVAPLPQAPVQRRDTLNGGAGNDLLVGGESAPADATAFAPKKLRRGSPELIRIVIHQPKDLQDVIKAARKIDPRSDPAPSSMKIGEIAVGASVGVSLEVRGAVCDGALQRRAWTGDALDFNFSIEPDADVKQAVFLARVFVDDAQIGVLAFTRPVSGASKNAHAAGDRVRLKRHKRVFISYSSKDRETVAAIATAYEAAGVEHFFDRTSLKSGEEWSPRLRREIDRADLFHLCWSRAASASEWVEKEAEHALERRRRSNGKRPNITVQMLDGPPWAPHPRHLDSINFDDFVRAAVVGYARGDGES